MGMTIEETLKGKGCPSPNGKRELRWSRSGRNQKFGRTTLLEAIAKGGNVTSYTAQDGTVRMKILVKKQDLKHILNLKGDINNNNNDDDHGVLKANHGRPVLVMPPASSSMVMERRLYDLMMKRRRSQSHISSSTTCSTWRPALHSIPEEQHSFF